MNGPAGPPLAPPVVRWYRAYCAFMTILYLAVTGLGLFLLSLDPEAAGPRPRDPDEILVNAIACLVAGPPLAVAYAVGLLAPERKWHWYYAIVLIAIGMTSCLCLPAAVPLLIFWIRPETKAAFESSSPLLG